VKYLYPEKITITFILKMSGIFQV